MRAMLRRKFQRRNMVFLLAAELQRHAAGRQHNEIWRGGKQIGYNRRGGHYLFKVIKH